MKVIKLYLDVVKSLLEVIKIFFEDVVNIADEMWLSFRTLFVKDEDKITIEINKDMILYYKIRHKRYLEIRSPITIYWSINIVKFGNYHGGNHWRFKYKGNADSVTIHRGINQIISLDNDIDIAYRSWYGVMKRHMRNKISQDIEKILLINR